MKRIKSDTHKKLQELILYIAYKCESMPNFGATMLNKILFFSDFLAYGKKGASITGEEYFKLDKGPAPKHLLSARENLEKDGDIIVAYRETTKGRQHRIVPVKREPDLSLFEPWQISLVDSVIEQFKGDDAESVSGLSHKFYGWQIAKDKEVIPYHTIFLKEQKSQQPPERLRRLMDKLARKQDVG